MSDHLVVERRDAIATVILNRPEVHNALSVATYSDLPGILGELDSDPTVKVVVLRGAGQRSFASGADISEFEAERSDAVKAKAYNKKVAAAEHAIEGLTKPTIAMIHGYCIGGGAGLALACDIRFADDRAKFAVTPAKLGLVYSLESTKRMVDLVGPSRAKWVLFGGLQIPAPRAYELGIFDEVVASEELEQVTYDFAETVCGRAQFSVRAGKVLVDKVVRGQARDDDATRELRNSSFDTEDFAEGVAAFMAKRPPKFTWS